MPQADGRWAWWNQYGNTGIDKCVTMAKEAKLNGVIVKAGYDWVFQRFKQGGIPTAIEAYCKPDEPEYWGKLLALDAVKWNCQFIVVNAEHEWEALAGDAGAIQMEALINAIRFWTPMEHDSFELYASVDTRGSGTILPYQQVLGHHATGWMPMIYPKAFYPTQPSMYVQRAFRDCLDTGQNWQGKPVYPTIQLYDNIGPDSVQEELNEVYDRELPGYQAYTVCHASNDEWLMVAEDRDEQPIGEEHLDEIIKQFNGQPLRLQVLNGDLQWEDRSLTRRQYIDLNAMGLVKPYHGHKAEVNLV